VERVGERLGLDWWADEKAGVLLSKFQKTATKKAVIYPFWDIKN
jgi:hypothetical protein